MSRAVPAIDEPTVLAAPCEAPVAKSPTVFFSEFHASPAVLVPCGAAMPVEVIGPW